MTKTIQHPPKRTKPDIIKHGKRVYVGCLENRKHYVGLKEVNDDQLFDFLDKGILP